MRLVGILFSFPGVLKLILSLLKGVKDLDGGDGDNNGMIKLPA